VLLVMSLVTKAYVFDLRPGSSFVESLLQRGFDVYSIDWGVPDAVESQNSFETYCDEYLPLAARAVLSTSGASELTVYGYCFGAVLSLLFMAGHQELPVRAFGIMATPVDFSQMGATSYLLREGRIDPEDLIDGTGSVPPQVVLDGIRTMKSPATWPPTPACSTTSTTASSSPPTRRSPADPGSHPFPGACALVDGSSVTTNWSRAADAGRAGDRPARHPLPHAERGGR
jgi:hypothetical protein